MGQAQLRRAESSGKKADGPSLDDFDAVMRSAFMYRAVTNSTLNVSLLNVASSE